MPRIFWTPNTKFTRLSIDGTLVGLDGLRGLIQKLLDAAKQFLAHEVLFGQRLAEMDELVQQQQQQHFFDVHQKKEPGYSFLDDPRNELQQRRYKDCLLRAFLTSPLTVERFVGSGSRRADEDGGDIEYNKDGCRAWLVKTGQFLDMLTALIHIGGGQPARAEELATLRIRNSSYGLRGVYYANDTIMLCTTYHKGRSISGRGKVIPRFLPLSVARLLLQYLVIVRPLEE
jgi:hypothetical protein